MKNYTVEVLIGIETAKKYVVATLELAETMAAHLRDDVTDVVIREVVL